MLHFSGSVGSISISVALKLCRFDSLISVFCIVCLLVDDVYLSGGAWLSQIGIRFLSLGVC